MAPSLIEMYHKRERASELIIFRWLAAGCPPAKRTSTFAAAPIGRAADELKERCALRR